MKDKLSPKIRSNNIKSDSILGELLRLCSIVKGYNSAIIMTGFCFKSPLFNYYVF